MARLDEAMEAIRLASIAKANKEIERQRKDDSLKKVREANEKFNRIHSEGNKLRGSEEENNAATAAAAAAAVLTTAKQMATDNSTKTLGQLGWNYDPKNKKRVWQKGTRTLESVWMTTEPIKEQRNETTLKAKFKSMKNQKFEGIESVKEMFVSIKATDKRPQ